MSDWSFVYVTGFVSLMEFALTAISAWRPWKVTHSEPSYVAGACVVLPHTLCVRPQSECSPPCIWARLLLIYCASQHKVSVINLSNWWNKRLLQEVAQARAADPPDNMDLLVWRKNLTSLISVHGCQTQGSPLCVCVYVCVSVWGSLTICVGTWRLILRWKLFERLWKEDIWTFDAGIRL